MDNYESMLFFFIQNWIANLKNEGKTNEEIRDIFISVATISVNEHLEGWKNKIIIQTAI